MKRILIILPILSLFLLSSCGPAAESREGMHSRAKTIADSMANLIKVAMDEAEMSGPAPVVINPTDSAAKTNPAVPPTSVQPANK